MLFANYNVMLGCCFVVVNRLLIFVMFPNDRRVEGNFRDAKVEGHSTRLVGLAHHFQGGRPGKAAITQRHWCIDNVVKKPERSESLSRFCFLL